MAVCVTTIRDLLLPGLMDITGSFAALKEQWAAHVFNEATGLFVPAAPAIIIPSLPAVLAMGAAVKIIENPEVDRRSFIGWMRGAFA